MLSADRLLKAAEVAKMSPETEVAAKECIVVSGGVRSAIRSREGEGAGRSREGGGPRGIRQGVKGDGEGGGGGGLNPGGAGRGISAEGGCPKP